MSKLPHHRLCVAISVSLLAIGSSFPALAKPQSHPKAKAVVVSQVENSAAVSDDNISPPPIEAILARVKVKSTTPAKAVRAAKISQTTVKATVAKVRVKQPSYHVGADRSLQGISNLTSSDRSKSNYENFSAVNRLID